MVCGIAHKIAYNKQFGCVELLRNCEKSNERKTKEWRDNIFSLWNRDILMSDRLTRVCIKREFKLNYKERNNNEKDVQTLLR